MEKINKYESLLRINEHDIESELMRQPAFYYHVSRNCAEAQENMDILKIERDRQIAETKQRLRRIHPKIAENKLDNLVLLEDEVLQTIEQFFEAKKIHDQWQGMRNAWEQRNFMLKELARIKVFQLHEKDHLKTTPKRDKQYTHDGKSWGLKE